MLPDHRPLGVIGVPTSAGAFAPGQEQAPQALREVRLLELLRDSGVDVRDHGDRELWRWRPDREHRRVQHVQKVAEIVRDTASRVRDCISRDEITLVLGGDCTVGVGTVAGHVDSGERVGLLYFDMHADLNVPDSVPDGALDWMGMAHMLGEQGAVSEFAGAGPRVPLLEDDQVLVFGWEHNQATEFERGVIERRGISVVSADEIQADPEGVAARSGELIGARCERLLVHFDVDVIDFVDMPLSENTGRNRGLSYEAAMRALEVLLLAPHLEGLTITELNPDHAETHGVSQFAADLAERLARSLSR